MRRITKGQIEGANLDISYSDLFHAPLDTKLIEWNDCKDLIAEDINDSIYACIGGDSTTGIQVSKMLRTDNLSRTKPTTKGLYIHNGVKVLIK